MTIKTKVARIISGLELSQKIKLVAMVPALVLLLVFLVAAAGHLSSAVDMHRTSQLLSVGTQVNDVVHYGQWERDATAVFLSSGDSAFQKRMVSQRRLVDQAYAGLSEALKRAPLTQSVEQRQLSEAIDGLKGRFPWRSRVDNGVMESPEAMVFYTQKLGDLLDVLEVTQRQLSPGQLSAQLGALYHVKRLKEWVALERAEASAAIANGDVSQAKWQQIMALEQWQAIHLDLVSQRLTFPGSGKYQKLISAQNMAEGQMTQWRAGGLKRENSLRGAKSAMQLFDTASRRMGLLRDFENTLTQDAYEVARWTSVQETIVASLYSIAGILLYLLAKLLTSRVAEMISVGVANSMLQIREKAKAEEWNSISERLGSAVSNMSESISLMEQNAGVVLNSVHGFTRATLKMSELEPKQLDGFDTFFEEVCEKMNPTGDAELALSIPGYAQTVTELEQTKNQAEEGLAEGLGGIESALEGVIGAVAAMEQVLTGLGIEKIPMSKVSDDRGPGAQALMGKRMQSLPSSVSSESVSSQSVEQS